MQGKGRQKASSQLVHAHQPFQENRWQLNLLPTKRLLLQGCLHTRPSENGGTLQNRQLDLLWAYTNNRKWKDLQNSKELI